MMRKATAGVNVSLVWRGLETVVTDENKMSFHMSLAVVQRQLAREFEEHLNPSNPSSLWSPSV